MKESPEEYLCSVFRKYGGMVARGLLSAQEFINGAFDKFAYADRVYVDILPNLWELVPKSVGGEFAVEVCRAALPGFRWHPLYIGGGRPMSEEELRRDAELRTSRVQAWAVEFVRFLDKTIGSRLTSGSS